MPIFVLLGLEMMNGGERHVHPMLNVSFGSISLGNGTAIPPSKRVQVAMVESPCVYGWPGTVNRALAIGYLYLSWSLSEYWYLQRTLFTFVDPARAG